MSNSLISYLLHNQPVVQQWEENQWVLRFPLESSPGFAWLVSSWPPDPEKDSILKTYLEVLGWTMTVRETDSAVEIRIDFGNAKI